MAFTSTPSPKQNVFLDLAVFTKWLSRSFNMSKKISNHSLPATVLGQAKYSYAKCLSHKLVHFYIWVIYNILIMCIHIKQGKMYLVWVHESVDIIF